MRHLKMIPRHKFRQILFSNEIICQIYDGLTQDCLPSDYIVQLARACVQLAKVK